VLVAVAVAVLVAVFVGVLVAVLVAVLVGVFVGVLVGVFRWEQSRVFDPSAQLPPHSPLAVPSSSADSHGDRCVAAVNGEIAKWRNSEDVA
jgi:hypothetical protein